MKIRSKVRLICDTIKDEALFGRSFFLKSIVYLGFGLVIQYYVYFLLSPIFLIIYIPLYLCVFILISPLCAKNYRKEFHSMSLWLAILMLISSVLAKGFAVIAFPPVTYGDLLTRLFLMAVAEPAFLISLITIAVLGHRASLRNNVGLVENFVDDEKKKWKKEVEQFPNFDEILESLDGGRFLPNLFDKGLFNLTILWSCNVMEEIMDSMTTGIITKIPEKKTSFRTEDGRLLRYPLQLKRLGYTSLFKVKTVNGVNVYKLWHEIRNKIAHHNHKPTFAETRGALLILNSFLTETPTVLKKWKLKFVN